MFRPEATRNLVKLVTMDEETFHTIVRALEAARDLTETREPEWDAYDSTKDVMATAWIDAPHTDAVELVYPAEFSLIDAQTCEPVDPRVEIALEGSDEVAD